LNKNSKFQKFKIAEWLILIVVLGSFSNVVIYWFSFFFGKNTQRRRDDGCVSA